MNDQKIRLFIELAGQNSSKKLHSGTPQQRALGAQLLLSEVLEYIIEGLGVTPEFAGTKITDPNGLTYSGAQQQPDFTKMVDGLADTAYTMYWNSVTFGVPLDKAFDLVCDNNLEKFVRLEGWKDGESEVPAEQWDFGIGVKWPKEVVRVNVIRTNSGYFAVGKDQNGKVRKPSTYEPVDLDTLVLQAANG